VDMIIYILVAALVNTIISSSAVDTIIQSGGFCLRLIINFSDNSCGYDNS
jgi:hypothetical protein